MKAFFLSFLMFLFTVSFALAGEQYGVYVKVIEKARGSFDDVSGSVESGLKSAGWEVLGTYDTGVPENCHFRSRVVIFSSDSYAASIMANGVKAAFALPLRAAIYEDETGINVDFVNPASINRTIVDETKLHDLSVSTSNAIAEVISKSVPGDVVIEQIGQIRNKGRVGGMGGGKFIDKIEEIFVASDASKETFKKVSSSVSNGILQNNKEWKLIYTYDLSEQGAIIFGIAKSKTEGKAFTIAGEKRSSKSYRFPGLDHGAAFPIEVIVYRDGGFAKAVTLDEMYRMKLYFEDAGMWAFMKNMGMPGQIEREIVEIAGSELDNGPAVR
jgi:uncharacterized protein (DUF302 family)